MAWRPDHADVAVLGFISALLATGGLTAGGCGSKETKTPTASIPGSAAAEGDQADGDRAGAAPFGEQSSKVRSAASAGANPHHDGRYHREARRRTCAALTVDNFLGYVGEGYYDNTLFHQVYSKPLAVILGGGYDMFGKEKAAHSTIRNEAHNGLKNRRGTIGMAQTARLDRQFDCPVLLESQRQSRFGPQAA